MLNIKIICIGKIKEKSMQDLIDQYCKRLSKYCKLDIIQLNDESLNNICNTAYEEIVKNTESNKIIDKLNKNGKSYIIALDLNGKEYSSIEFSDKIKNNSMGKPRSYNIRKSEYNCTHIRHGNI